MKDDEESVQAQTLNVDDDGVYFECLSEIRRKCMDNRFGDSLQHPAAAKGEKRETLAREVDAECLLPLQARKREEISKAKSAGKK